MKTPAILHHLKRVRAAFAAFSPFSLKKPHSTHPFDIRNYGALGDGKTINTVAIQTAIDHCHGAGGGTVVVPAGDFLTGMLRLYSHVTLRLTNGATLLASRRVEDYSPSGHGDDPSFGSGESTYRKDYRYLLVADNQEDIILEGDGTVMGIGETDLLRRANDVRPAPPFRIGILLFRNCVNITIRDLTFRYSDFWTLHFWRCARLRLHGLSILNHFFHTNSDGIDPVSCRDVIISDCHIVAGDDCICLKADPGRACEDVVVTNCTLESAATAIKLGTASHGDFSDILISNCTIRNTTVGIGIYIKDGGTAQRVNFSNITIRTLEDPAQVNDELKFAVCPIYLDVEQRTPESRIGTVREITFRDIQIESIAGILIQGMPESPLQNITLQNIFFRANRNCDYATRHKPTGGKFNAADPRITLYIRQPTYAALAHIDGLTVENFQVLIDETVFAQASRSALAVFESTRIRLHHCTRLPVGRPTGEPVATLENCRNVFVNGCHPAPTTPGFLRVRGERSDKIALGHIDLQNVQHQVQCASTVPPSVVKVAGS